MNWSFGVSTYPDIDQNMELKFAMPFPARRIGLLAFVLAVVMHGLSGAAIAQTAFDGSWSILVITDAGDCDRAYRYGVRIDRGVIRYEGETGIEFSGRVDASGRVTARVGRGEQSAEGTGRLYRNGTGAGTWRGKSPTGLCSGRWEAERRSR